jgi:SAM-dependent methyltransferase
MSFITAIAKRTVPEPVRRYLRDWVRGVGPISGGYELIKPAAYSELCKGYKQRFIAKRQHQAFVGLLEELRQGRPRKDFRALADAVGATRTIRPLIIEVGCGSGWNAEVLSILSAGSFQYIGVDYSQWMIDLARKAYPDRHFVLADATALPFRDRVCEILLSGTVLMHVLNYRQAISESRRVASRWCIFHTIPVVQRRETTVFRKCAYGQPVLEVAFNEGEFRAWLQAEGLRVRYVMESIPYDLEHLLKEPSETKTFVCEVEP